MRLRGDGTRLAAGRIALGLASVIAGGALVSLAIVAGTGGGGTLNLLDPSILSVLRFTVWQAVLSTVLSVGLALPLALALADEPRFPGRAALLALFAVPLALPALAAALGVLGVFGRSGFVNDALHAAGLPRLDVYGLPGILLAHVFFNLPLATRILLGALDAIPGEYRRQAAILGLRRWDWLRLVEWHFLARSVAGAAALVMTLCLTSFTIVLTLGGGPAATTLEVAIYQSLAFDFDPARTVALTLLQLTLAVAAYVLVSVAGGTDGGFGMTLGRSTTVRLRRAPWLRRAGFAVIVAGAVYVAGPMVALVARGFSADFSRLLAEPDVWRALVTSLALGAAAALLAVVFALALVQARSALVRRDGSANGPVAWVAGPGSSLAIAVPPLVIGAGWFVVLRLFADPFRFAAPMVIGVNALMALPFCLRLIRPAHDAAAERHDRLAAGLGLSLASRLALVDLPALRRPLILAFAFALALSIGDLGVIALYGSDSVQTLPWLILQRMGSYRTHDAAGLTLILCVLTTGLLLLAGRAGRAT